MPVARAAGAGFFPLDEHLALLPGSHLTPTLIEDIVRLGAHVPFAQVPPLIAHFRQVQVDAETVRRLTEAAGSTQETLETAAVARIERELPAPPVGPALQLLSVDGAMVPLVGGRWSEVKTLAIGVVEPAASDPAQIQTRALSYFSRLTDVATFSRLATVETQRRGTETARTVVAVVDGAEWCQSFIDHQRQDAVRILDFAHALGHLGTVAQLCLGAGTPAASDWLGQQAHALRHGQEDTVLTHLAALAETGSDAGRAVAEETHAYLTSRREHIRYQTFADAGYPIGSGCVESANKLLVEARLKGSGMHWVPANVNPMLALRGLVCNGHWEVAWPDLWTAWRERVRTQARERRSCRPVLAAPQVMPLVTADRQSSELPEAAAARRRPASRPKTIVNGKPTAEHPWRRASPFRATR